MNKHIKVEQLLELLQMVEKDTQERVDRVARKSNALTDLDVLLIMNPIQAMRASVEEVANE